MGDQHFHAHESQDQGDAKFELGARAKITSHFVTVQGVSPGPSSPVAFSGLIHQNPTIHPLVSGTSRLSARLRAKQTKKRSANNLKIQYREEWENVSRGAFPLVAGSFLGPSGFDSRPAGRPLKFILGRGRWDGGLSGTTAS